MSKRDCFPPLVTRAAVVACARTYIGTRWHHQGRVKGVGIDCAGLIICVASELGLANARVEGYSRYADGESLMAYCAHYMDPISPMEADEGDVLVMTFTDHPQHIAFLSSVGDRPSLIHSYADARGVVEHHLDKIWRDRIRGAFHIPGVE